MHVALNREEQERVEGELNECNKFPSTSQGQTRSLILIEYFTVGVINHPFDLCKSWGGEKGMKKLSETIRGTSVDDLS